MSSDASKVVCQYNWLGSSGLKVSNICLGTMNFGEHSGGRPSCSESEAHAILDRYDALGGNFIDTADMYQFGKSEEIIGRWLAKQERDRFIIATKCCRPMSDTNPNCRGLSRKHIYWSLEQSLKRLQTDYVDIFYMHVWDSGTPLEETLSALNDLVRSGKIRYMAASNMKGWQLQKTIEICRNKGYDKIVCLQQQYNLLCRSTEFEVTEVCRNEGVGLLPWSPLKGGWLSGKMKRGAAQPAEGTRIAWAQEVKGRAHHSHPDYDWFSENKQAWDLLDKLDEIAKAHGRTVAQVAVRWLLQKGNIPSVVVGPRTLAHLEDNMAAASGWEITEQQMSELDSVSAIHWPYPYDYIELANRGRERP